MKAQSSQQPVNADAPAVALTSTLGYLTTEEVADLLGITKGRLQNRMSQGMAPPSFKVGTRHLFDTKELHAWIRRQRVDRGRR